jgi:excisionase family DNA binding protein
MSPKVVVDRDGTGTAATSATPVGGGPRKSSVDARDFSRRGKLLTAREAAAYLGISEPRMRRLVAAGEIAVIRNKRGRLAGCYAEDLDAWVGRRRQPAVGEGKWRPVDDAMRRLIKETA